MKLCGRSTWNMRIDPSALPVVYAPRPAPAQPVVTHGGAAEGRVGHSAVKAPADTIEVEEVAQFLRGGERQARHFHLNQRAVGLDRHPAPTPALRVGTGVAIPVAHRVAAEPRYRRRKANQRGHNSEQAGDGRTERAFHSSPPVAQHGARSIDTKRHGGRPRV